MQFAAQTPARTVARLRRGHRQETHVKKIALAAAAMGGTALIAFGASGTFAAFSDTEQATASAGAGSLDLTVSGAPVTTAPAAMALNPGQSTTQAYWINNAGTMAGTLSADLAVVENAENSCAEPETESGDKTCEWGSGGEFTKYATVEFLTAGAVDEAACRTAKTGQSLAPAVTLDAAAAATRADLFSIEGGKGKCVVVAVTLPGSAANDVQGDTAKFRADLTLTQVVAGHASGWIIDNPNTPIEEIPSLPGGPFIPGGGSV
jgi:hypothetical protein